MIAGVGVLVGLLVLLRLTGSSSSPSEKNWPLLELQPAVTAAAGEPQLLVRSDELPATTPLLSVMSPGVRVFRLSWEASEVRDSLEPVPPSLLNAE